MHTCAGIQMQVDLIYKPLSVKPSITQFIHTQNRSIPKSTSLYTKIAHRRWKTTSPCDPPSPRPANSSRKKALRIADRMGKNRITHQISKRKEAEQKQSSGPAKSGARRCTPRIFVDATPSFSGGCLCCCNFLKTRANFCKELQALDYSMYTHQKALQSEVAIPLH